MIKAILRNNAGMTAFNLYGDGVPGRYVEFSKSEPVEVTVEEADLLKKLAPERFDFQGEEQAVEPEKTEVKKDGEDHREKRPNKGRRKCNRKHPKLDG